jgi:hypothetical protein
MQQATPGCHRHHRQGVGQSLGHQIGAFQRIYRHVYLGLNSCPYLLADIEHGGFIHFSFTNDHCAVDIDRIKNGPHGIHGSPVSRFLVSPSHETAGSQGGRFRYTDKFQGQLSFHQVSSPRGCIGF